LIVAQMMVVEFMVKMVLFVGTFWLIVTSESGQVTLMWWRDHDGDVLSRAASVELVQL